MVKDDELLDETSKNIIKQPLNEFVDYRKRKDLRDLRGKIQFAEGYDYKKLRKGK